MSRYRSTSRIAPKGTIRLSSGFARLTATLGRTKSFERSAFARFLHRFADARRHAAHETYKNACVGACTDTSPVRPADDPDPDPEKLSTKSRPLS